VDWTLDPDLARFADQVVRSALGASARVIRVTSWPAAPGQAVWRLDVGHPAAGVGPQPLVLKVATAAASRAGSLDFERTAAVLALADRAGVPVARVLAADGSHRQGPWSYLLTEHLRGVEWRVRRPQLSEGAVRTAHRQIAAALLALQSIRFPSCGELNRDGQPAGQDVTAALAVRVRLRVPAGSRRALADRLLEREAELLAANAPLPTLCHDDLHHANVLFSTDGEQPRLTGILDWDKAWAGPADSDVARLAFWDDMTGPGFWEVYGELDRGEQSGRRRLVHQLLWCLEYPLDSPRHRRDTAELCRRLDLPPPGR